MSLFDDFSGGQIELMEMQAKAIVRALNRLGRIIKYVGIQLARCVNFAALILLCSYTYYTVLKHRVVDVILGYHYVPMSQATFLDFTFFLIRLGASFLVMCGPAIFVLIVFLFVNERLKRKLP